MSQFIPIDGWRVNTGYLVSIITTDGIIELEFALQKSSKLLQDALQELLDTKDKSDISVKTFMIEDDQF